MRPSLAGSDDRQAENVVTDLAETLKGTRVAGRVATPKGRRPQPERRAAMQERLLDATVECLVEVGWARTTLPEVVARADVGRGAQVHHFPTKAALMAAVGEHLLLSLIHISEPT